MIQEIWKLKIGWEDDLTEGHKIEWSEWFNELRNLKLITIERQYFSENVKETQLLRIFCDSSKLSYGAVAYLKGRSNNNISTTFVLAKTKVAPVKTQPLPRLSCRQHY